MRPLADAPPPPSGPTLRVATLNVRNTADRWRRRRHLLVAQLVELQPDVIGLQELRRWPSQAAWIVRNLNAAFPGGGQYRSCFTGKTGLWGLWEGVAVVTRLPVLSHGSLDLRGDHRAAGWARVAGPGGAVVHFVDAHLAAGDAALRDRQARLLLDHVVANGDVATVLVGDLNARPGSPALTVLGERLRSAHTLVHGREPERTFPTPLRGAARSGVVIDYVLVSAAVQVHDAWRTFERPDAAGSSLFASDHYGVAATVAAPLR